MGFTGKGNIMKNFLSKHYKHYYLLTNDNQSVETTRAECIAPGKEPTVDNPYKQRWYCDIEAGYIIRLLRNEQGEKLYRDNGASLKKEERYQFRKYACVSKGTGNCDNNCAKCTITKIARTVDLDKPINGGENSDDCVYLEIEESDHFAEMEEEEEKKEEYGRLYEVIGLLSDKQKQVCNLYFFKDRTAKEIGEMYGVSKEAIIQQLSTIKKKIKQLF